MKVRIRAGNRVVAGAMVSFVMLLAAVPAGMAGGSADPSPASARELEKRIERLEQANRTLAERNRSIQQQLSEQAGEIGALKQQLQASAAPVRNLQQKVPRMKQQVAAIEKQQKSVPFSVGFWTGWAESPYDMPGGFFYGAFLNDRLLTQEDGIPYGDVSGELMAGVILGNHAVTSGNLASALGVVGPASSWLTTVEIEPTLQYHLDLASVGLFTEGDQAVRARRAGHVD